MPFCYSDNGLSMRAVASDYLAAEGEVLFNHSATMDELTAAFAGYTVAKAVENAPAQFQVLINNGLQITSTNTPLISATYATDPQAEFNIVALETSLVALRGFPPGGAPTYGFPDITRTKHVVTASQFTDIAAAIRDFISAAEDAFAVKLAGGAADWPSNQATIT